MKYIVFGVDSLLWTVMYGSWIDRNDIYIVSRPKNKIRHLLHRTLFSTKINRKLKLPGKKRFIQHVINKCQFKKNDEIIVLLYDAAFEIYFSEILDSLKECYPNIQFVYIWENPCDEETTKKYKKISHYISSVFTFDKKVAQQNGWNYYQFPYSGYKQPLESLPESDLFFVGANKGRYKKILHVFEQASSKGLNCDFHIVGVDEKEQNHPESIQYNVNLPYLDNLRGIMASKCLLEIVQGNLHHCTIRTLEALYYRKKLLTSNKDVFDYIDVSSDVVQVYDYESGLIDYEFIIKAVPESSFPSRESLSPDRLLQKLQRSLL